MDQIQWQLAPHGFGKRVVRVTTFLFHDQSRYLVQILATGGPKQAAFEVPTMIRSKVRYHDIQKLILQTKLHLASQLVQQLSKYGFQIPLPAEILGSRHFVSRQLGLQFSDVGHGFVFRPLPAGWVVEDQG